MIFVSSSLEKRCFSKKSPFTTIPIALKGLLLFILSPFSLFAKVVRVFPPVKSAINLVS